ncbi:MAG TPA: GAF domain-containing protein [Anaerolineae bacterium]|nr:GAF domain-containing protein [Anaerolineae bacterium]
MTTIQLTPPSSRLKRLGRGISRRWQRLIEPHPSIQDPGTRRQVQLQTAFILVLIIVFAVSALSAWQAEVQKLRPETLALFTSTVVFLAAYWLSRTRRYEWGAIVVVTSLSLAAFAIVVANPASANTIFYAFIPLTFVIGGFLLRTSYAVVLVAVDTALIFCMPLLRPGQIAFRDVAAEGGVILSVGILLIVFASVRDLTERDRLEVLTKTNQELQDLQGTLEQRVAERTAQLQTSAEVGQAAAATLDSDQLLRQVVNLITERFGFYYAAVFTLNDTGTAALLREATGEAGRILRERAHQLEVNETSMVGYAISQRRARIALDVGLDPVRFANPLLPETRSEIALPLIASDRVLGALDVQSTQPAAFDESSAVVLQSMADQIAVALKNAEQFKQAEAQARRQSELNQFSRGLFSATSTEDLYRVLATALPTIVPHDYLGLALAQGTTLREYRLQAAAEQILTEGPVYALQNTLSGRAYTTRHPAVSRNLDREEYLNDLAQLQRLGYHSALSLPLNIGERILGTLNFASRSAEVYSLESPTWFEQLAGQVSAALETQRLAEAQRTSLREMEALTRQLSGQAWAKRWQRQAGEAVLFARSGIGVDVPTSTPEIETVIAQHAPLIRTESNSSGEQSPYQAALAVPIVLRGEVLGGLQVGEAHQAREWTQDDLTFMQAVADQVALALDNARLIEETQQRAERERLVADISSRMFAANDLETIVQIAGEELGRVLQVKQTTVKVRAESSAASIPTGNGQTPDQHA